MEPHVTGVVALHSPRTAIVDFVAVARALADDVVAPNRAGAWLARPGRSGGVDAVPLPRTGMLGIPANPLGEDVRAVIGWGGAGRAYLDRLMPVLRIDNRDLQPGPFYRRARELYWAYAHSQPVSRAA